ncbi:MAG: hypothetical protein JNL11_03515 [Bdellovibrionaceae bacterium]|nr:hypothetical protein [Pseudobdellovibrionaceae bacterium]
MQKLIVIFIFSVALVGCGNSSSEGTKSEGILNDSSFDCEKSFQTDWCSQNLASSSDITSICKGKIYAGDIIYYSFYIKSSSANSCLVDLGLGTKSVTIGGCSGASQAKLSSNEGIVEVLSCYNSAGSDTYVEGTLSNGQMFRAIHAE